MHHTEAFSKSEPRTAMRAPLRCAGPTLAMSDRCVRLALRVCGRKPRASVQGPCSFGAHGRFPSPQLPLRQPPVETCRRAFMSTHGVGDAGGAVAEGAPVHDAGAPGAGPSFPWRGAPNLVAQPEDSLLAKMVTHVLDQAFLAEVDLKAGAEAAFVCTAAAFFGMRPSEVRTPKMAAREEKDESSEEQQKGAAGENEEEGKKEGTVPAAGASPADEEPSAEAAEEDLQRALEAIDTGLVTFSSDEGAPVRARGAVPYYRLHKVVAAAVTRKAFILGGRRGEELPNLSSVSNSSSMTILMDADNLGETIKTAMDGNMSFVFQVDVDLACEETFYVTDAKSGELTQGRNKSTGRIHRIRLESCTTPNESIDKTPAWKVIDLDGWLNGNSFC